MTLSLLDREGLRHEIDPETWFSKCVSWVIAEMDDSGSGFAELRVEGMTFKSMQVLGSGSRIHMPFLTRVTADIQPFGKSDEPISCLQCIGGD